MVRIVTVFITLAMDSPMSISLGNMVTLVDQEGERKISRKKRIQKGTVS